MNQLADRLRDTEADLKQAQEAYEFKCQELKERENDIKKLREALAKEHRINETRENMLKEFKRFFWNEMFDADAMKLLRERVFKL